MKKKRFKVGNKITYKKREDCLDGNCRKEYYFGGLDNGGFVGTIRGYGDFNEDMGCYEISVTNNTGGLYSMLECEFEEYGKASAKTSDLFPIY